MTRTGTNPIPKTRAGRSDAFTHVGLKGLPDFAQAGVLAKAKAMTDHVTQALDSIDSRIGSKTADLIDCTASPTDFDGKTLHQIASELARPFGINVINQGVPTTRLQRLQADYGETVHEVLNKALGLQQALAWDDEDGNLLIGKVGTDRATTALVYGENILSCDTEQSIRDRFSEYQVAGQRSGDDADFGEATLTMLRAHAKDPRIRRYRPCHLPQSGNATLASCRERAEFEAQQRAARTEETTYTVQGWRQGDGRLWQPNQRVIVLDPVLGVHHPEMS